MICSRTIFETYEGLKDKLPASVQASKKATLLHTTEELATSAQCFFLDAFGILNIGTKAIPGAHAFIAHLRQHNIPFLILTNSASYPKKDVCKKFTSLGFDFAPEEIISSREVLWSCLPTTQEPWGVIGIQETLEKPINAVFLGEEKFWECSQFLFLSSSVWDDALQERWLKHLQNAPYDLWVANPDITAPREDGTFSREPGFFTLAEPTITHAHYVGKPFDAVFDYALDIAYQRWNIEAKEVMMVGDTLHTDILGANAKGLKSALVEGYGFFKGHDTKTFIEKSGIVPDVRLKSYT